MSSLFSFLRSREGPKDEEQPEKPKAKEPLAEPTDAGPSVEPVAIRSWAEPSDAKPAAEAVVAEPLAEPTPGTTPTHIAARADAALALTTNAAPSRDAVVEQMLADLKQYLPADGDSNGLPEDGVSVVSVTERTVGLGNRRGTETLGSFAVIALKGARLDAVVRFQVWAANPAITDSKIQTLHENLLQAQDELWIPHSPPNQESWIARFLRLVARETSLVEHIPSLDAWRKTADYQVLYEFQFHDTDGAKSLIARIPITVDDEHGESTIVTDEMVRWDGLGAPTPLELRGESHRAFRIGMLTVLAFLPGGWDGGAVSVSASVGGAVTEEAFGTMRAFIEAFDLDKENEEEGKPKTVTLGGKPYVAGRMVFPNADFPDPIVLKGGEDAFSVTSAAFDNDDAVVYLRVLT